MALGNGKALVFLPSGEHIPTPLSERETSSSQYPPHDVTTPVWQVREEDTSLCRLGKSDGHEGVTLPAPSSVRMQAGCHDCRNSRGWGEGPVDKAVCITLEDRFGSLEPTKMVSGHRGLPIGA